LIEKAVAMRPDLSKIKDSFSKEVTKDIKDSKIDSRRTKKDEELEKKKKDLDEALLLLKKEKEELTAKQQKIPLEKTFPKKIDIKKVENI
jgi:hypothetical protein